MAPLFYPAELSNIRHTRSKVGWKNEHTAGMIAAKAQNASSARAMARFCKAGRGYIGK